MNFQAILKLVKQDYVSIVKHYSETVRVTDNWKLLCDLVKLQCLIDGWNLTVDAYLRDTYRAKLKLETPDEAKAYEVDQDYVMYNEDSSTQVVLPIKDYPKVEISKLYLDNVSDVHFILPIHREGYNLDIRLTTDIILQDAKLMRATDVHIITEADNTLTGFKYSVKFRRGLNLHEQPKFSFNKDIVDEIIKDMLKTRSSVGHKFSELGVNSAVRFRLIDKRFPARCQVSKSIAGKTLVIRMFDFSSAPSIELLGFSKETESMLESTSRMTGGLTLVSGVFGSGKGTTLNAVGMRMEEEGKLSIASLDDPTEYLRKYPQYEYSNELQLQEYVDAFKKMDLNVVFLNEIILNPVADAVFNLVSAGVHVLSTIHTNRVYRIMYKMQELFGQKYLNLIPFINTLTYQDKFSITCKSCMAGVSKDGYLEDSDERKLLTYLNLETFKQPFGCVNCNKGINLKGIRVFSEHISFTDDIKSKLLRMDVHEQFVYLKSVVENGNSLEKEIRQALINGEVLLSEALLKLDTWR